VDNKSIHKNKKGNTVMKILPLFVAALFTLLTHIPAQAQSSTKPGSVASCPASLNFKFPRLQDEVTQDLCQYKGKVVMVVNTASYCGFTPQYEALEKIYADYSAKGFVIIGFPSNDFGSQEPGSNKEIAEFCKNTYDVKFPMIAKTVVSGSEANPLFKYLIDKTKTTPKWNFYKYLIDRDGNVVEAYSSLIKPDSKKVTAQIEKLLAGSP
jgi:glutathione peroxidase